MDSFWGEERVDFEQRLDRLVAWGSVLDRKKLEGFYHFRHFAPNLGTAYIHFSVLCRVIRQNILCYFHKLLIQRNLFSVAHEIPGLSWQTERIKGTKILNGGNSIPIVLILVVFWCLLWWNLICPLFYCVAKLLLHKIFLPFCLVLQHQCFQNLFTPQSFYIPFNTPKFTKPR